MKVNITGLLRGVLRAVDPDKDEGAYTYAVEELIGHIDDVRAGLVTLKEFTDFYCMVPEASSLNKEMPGTSEMWRPIDEDARDGSCKWIGRSGNFPFADFACWKNDRWTFSDGSFLSSPPEYGELFYHPLPAHPVAIKRSVDA